MPKISILGCGWLGLPLAQSLIQNGFPVNGSTTSAEKIEILKSKGINPFLVNLTPEAIDGDIKSFLHESEILIIDIPPKLRGDNSESFTDKIKTLLPHIETSGIKKVLFVSSTSVYADDNLVVTEETLPAPETESGKQLVISEGILQSNTHFKTTIVRFGGLISEDRQPVKFLAGKENLENPDGPVNIIHRKDCIGIIHAIIKHDAWGEIFNGVTPYYPTREDHYTKLAIAMGLPAPKFSRAKPSQGKTVSSQKVIRVLGYDFKQ